MGKSRYPSWKHHASKRPRLVQNFNEEAEARGEGYFDTPNVHRELLSLAGESSESKVRQNHDISQAREAFHERLKDRAYSERPLDDLPACCVTVSSWEVELKEFVSGFIRIYLTAWEQMENSKNSKENRWFRESLVRRGVGRLVQDERKTLERDYRKYVRSTIDQDEVEQHMKPFRELDTSVPEWARSKAGVSAPKSARPEETPKGPETKSFTSDETLQVRGKDTSRVDQTGLEIEEPGRKAEPSGPQHRTVVNSFRKENKVYTIDYSGQRLEPIPVSLPLRHIAYLVASARPEICN